MAKRRPRSEAADTTAPPEAPPRSRSRLGRAAAASEPAPQGAPETALPENETPQGESQAMASEPSEDDIRLRAYHLYLERGGTHGAHEDDWVRAERELKKKEK